MLQFAYPWIIVLLPVPILVRWLGRPRHEFRSALHVPFVGRLSRSTGQKLESGAVVRAKGRLQLVALCLIWVLLIGATARPQHVGEPITKLQPVRDLLVAVDLSGSMETEDFTDPQGKRVDRVTAVKQVLDEFLERREGDRVGLIFFGNAPFLQVPFTEDLDVCRSLLKEARARMAGPQTMLGDAIGKAITIFDRSELEEKVLILLTDGNDTGSLIPPVKAAEIANDKGITIHVIGIGDPTAVGEEKFDSETLEHVATTTGGKSFLAINREELGSAYDVIDGLTTRDAKTLSHRPVTELYYWPLLAAILLSLAYHSLMWLQHWRENVDERRHSKSVRPISAAAVFLPFIAISSWTTVGFGSVHILRAEMFLLIIPAGLLVWKLLQQNETRHGWRKFVQSELLNALLSRRQKQSTFQPVFLLTAIWLVGIIALSGPVWRLQPSPFAEEKAALAIALAVKPSMSTTDVQPSRHERAVQKIHDILAQRQGAKSSLIAYAGSAHIVMPLTKDSEIINSFAAELSPDIMPKEGQDAVVAYLLAQQSFGSSKQSGSFLIITDAIDMADAIQIGELLSAGGPPIEVLGMLDPVANKSEADLLQKSVQAMGARLEWVAFDDDDVMTMVAHFERNLARAVTVDGKQNYKEDGYWLVPLLTLLSLTWFRPGWVVAWD